MKYPSDFSEEDRMASLWLDGIHKGESQGLDSLYALYHRPILSLLCRILNDMGAAEEVLQDVFVRTYHKAGQFDPELGTPFSWMATIGKRMALDRLRKARRRKNILLEEREQSVDLADNNIPDASSNGQIESDSLWVGEILSTVSDTQKEVIDLAFLQGYTHIEISKALNKPLGTVKSDLRRGMKQLRKHYLEKHD